jgi:hypothetical protein
MVFVNSIYKNISISHSIRNPQMITIWATILNSMTHSTGNQLCIQRQSHKKHNWQKLL